MGIDQNPPEHPPLLTRRTLLLLGGQATIFGLLYGAYKSPRALREAIQYFEKKYNEQFSPEPELKIEIDRRERHTIPMANYTDSKGIINFNAIARDHNTENHEYVKFDGIGDGPWFDSSGEERLVLDFSKCPDIQLQESTIVDIPRVNDPKHKESFRASCGLVLYGPGDIDGFSPEQNNELIRWLDDPENTHPVFSPKSKIHGTDTMDHVICMIGSDNDFRPSGIKGIEVTGGKTQYNKGENTIPTPSILTCIDQSMNYVGNRFVGNELFGAGYTELQRGINIINTGQARLAVNIVSNDVWCVAHDSITLDGPFEVFSVNNTLAQSTNFCEAKYRGAGTPFGGVYCNGNHISMRGSTFWGQKGPLFYSNHRAPNSTEISIQDSTFNLARYHYSSGTADHGRTATKIQGCTSHFNQSTPYPEEDGYSISQSKYPQAIKFLNDHLPFWKLSRGLFIFDEVSTLGSLEVSDHTFQFDHDMPSVVAADEVIVLLNTAMHTDDYNSWPDYSKNGKLRIDNWRINKYDQVDDLLIAQSDFLKLLEKFKYKKNQEMGIMILYDIKNHRWGVAIGPIEGTNLTIEEANKKVWEDSQIVWASDLTSDS